MTDSHNENSKSHRLFHAMVLMGGSLALGCGGLSSKDSHPDVGGSDSGGAPSGNSGGSGSTGSAGRKSTGSGGMASGGSAGSKSIPTAAGAGGQTPVTPQPPCPPSQWDCSEVGISCAASGFAVPNGCSCDASRPKSAADCPKGQSFVCHNGTYDAKHQRLAQPIAFDCQCKPNQSNCELVCDEFSGQGSTCTQKSSDDGTSVLCNCAVIVLR